MLSAALLIGGVGKHPPPLLTLNLDPRTLKPVFCLDEKMLWTGEEVSVLSPLAKF